jgi:hypothetical protein
MPPTTVTSDTSPLLVVALVLWFLGVPHNVDAKAILVYADPCTSVCTFNLCVSGPLLSEVEVCPDPCQANLRVSLPAKLQNGAGPVQRVVQGRVKIKVAGTRAKLVCVATALPCQLCSADRDCDDHNAATVDLCLNEACAHVCR